MRFGEFEFYNTDKLSIEEKISMLRECKDISYVWWADTLDCTFSLSRQKFDCSFDEILEKLNEKARVVVINRGIWGSPLGEDIEHFEVGFCTFTSPVEYFLFIQVESVKMPPILRKYNLSIQT